MIPIPRVQTIHPSDAIDVPISLVDQRSVDVLHKEEPCIRGVSTHITTKVVLKLLQVLVAVLILLSALQENRQLLLPSDPSRVVLPDELSDILAEHIC